MFCVEEHKWGYFTRIYIGALGTRPHLGGHILTWGATRCTQVRTRCLLVRTRSLRARTYAYIIFTLRRFLFHVSFS